MQARLTELDVGPAAGEDSDFSNAGHSLGERKRDSNAAKSGTYYHLVWGPGSTKETDKKKAAKRVLESLKDCCGHVTYMRVQWVSLQTSFDDIL